MASRLLPLIIGKITLSCGNQVVDDDQTMKSRNVYMYIYMKNERLITAEEAIDIPIPLLLVAHVVDATRSGDIDGSSRVGVMGPLNPFAQSMRNARRVTKVLTTTSILMYLLYFKLLLLCRTVNLVAEKFDY